MESVEMPAGGGGKGGSKEDKSQFNNVCLLAETQCPPVCFFHIALCRSLSKFGSNLSPQLARRKHPMSVAEKAEALRAPQLAFVQCLSCVVEGGVE